MILAIDIGGTKTLVAFYQQLEDETWHIVKQQKYQSSAYENITDILTNFADKQAYQQVVSICAGVAGPIINNTCQLTNLSWKVSVSELSQATGVQSVSLLNDLEATAWGIHNIEPADLLNINESAVAAKAGHIAILSAGTGLGEAMLIREADKVIVVASEGGHTDFAPQNTEQDNLLCFLREKYQGHVSYERLVSGEGLYNIYQFLKQTGKFPENNAIKLKIHDVEEPATVIGSVGILKEDLLCEAAIRLFCEIYAAEAANLALKCLPYSGIVLAGGISPKLLPAIKSAYFLEAFLNKGRYEALLQNLPIYVCLNEEIVLFGAFSYAKQSITSIT